MHWRYMISKDIIDRLDNLSCEEVAEKLGISVQRHKALCFMHDDHNPSLSFYGKGRNRWKCFVCDKGGNAISLVQTYNSYTFTEACTWLMQHFYGWTGELNLRDGRIRPKKIITHKETEKTSFSSDIAQSIIKYSCLTQSGKHFLITDRKYAPEVISKLSIVSIERGDELTDKMQNEFDDNALINSGFFTKTNGKMYLKLFTPCLIFPYYDEKMSIIGIQSRYIGTSQNVPRFQFISGQKTRVFNLPIIKELKYGEDLYISEGITDCIALLSVNKKAVAIPSATILPFDDLYKLRYYKLHMYPDSDDAGYYAFAKLKKFYINHFTTITRETLPEGVKDYSDYYKMITQ